MDDRADVARRKPRPRQRQPGAAEHHAHRIVRDGEDLAGAAGAVVLHRHVGERAADVDGEPGACHRAASSSVPAARGSSHFRLERASGVPADRTAWRDLAVMGILNNAIPFGLIVWGQVRITGGLASVMSATQGQPVEAPTSTDS